MKRAEPAKYVFVDPSGNGSGANVSANASTTNGTGDSAAPVATIDGAVVLPAATPVAAPPQPPPPPSSSLSSSLASLSLSAAPVFHVRLTVGERVFPGRGVTAQAAKHDAATNALRVIKVENSCSLSSWFYHNCCTALCS